MIRILKYVKKNLCLVNVLSKNLVNITFNIDLEFYYNDFDWGIIYR